MLTGPGMNRAGKSENGSTRKGKEQEDKKQRGMGYTTYETGSHIKPAPTMKVRSAWLLYSRLNGCLSGYALFRYPPYKYIQLANVYVFPARSPTRSPAFHCGLMLVGVFL